MPAHLLSPHTPWAPPVVGHIRAHVQAHLIPATTVWLPTQGAKRAFRHAWAASGGGLLPRLVTPHGSFEDFLPLALPPTLWPTEAETAAIQTLLYDALGKAEQTQTPSPTTRWQQAFAILDLLVELPLANSNWESVWQSVPPHLAQHWHANARVLQAVVGAFHNAIRRGEIADLPALAAARWAAFTQAIQTGHHILVAPPRQSVAERTFTEAAAANPNAHLFTLQPSAEPNLTASYSVINAPHRASEALAITAATRHALATNQTPIVLAVGEPALATLIIHHLRAAGIAPKGFLPHPLGQTPLGHLLQALTAFTSGLPEGRALAILAHIQSTLVPEHQGTCGWLEQHVFRGPTPRHATANGWLGKLRRTRTDDESTKQAAEALFTRWQTAGVFTVPKTATLGGWCDWLHTALDALWPNWRTDPHALTWQANCRAWHAANYGLNGADFRAWLTRTLEEWCTEDSAQTEPDAPILTGRLAGWSGAKTLIVAGLSESQWQPTLPHPWLSEGQRATLNLPTNTGAKQLAESELAHLLAGAGAAHVVLSRSLSEGTTPMPPIALLQTFATRHAGLFPAWEEQGRAFLPSATAPVQPVSPTAFPWPAPESWSPSMVETVLSCPFKAALQRLARLEPWEPFDAWPDARHFGNLLHDAAQSFWENYPMTVVTAQDAPAALATLQSIALNLLEKNQPEQTHLWAPRIRTLSIALVQDWVRAGEEGWENAGTETQLTATLGTILLKGRADKIDIRSDGTLQIIDYKTGQPPSEAEMQSGKKPQLPMLAWMLHKAGKPNVQGAFWQLVGYGARGVEAKSLKDPVAHIQRVEDNLGRILAPFATQLTAHFPATPGMENAGILPSGPCETCPAAGWCRYPAWANGQTGSITPQVTEAAR